MIDCVPNFSPHPPLHHPVSALLDSGDFNVVLVDWSPLTALPWYVNSVQNGPRVGRFIARFIRFLVLSNFPLKQIHLIGFSLGAEVAGFAGKTLNEWGMKLPRITGKDPSPRKMARLLIYWCTQSHVCLCFFLF